MFRRMSLLQKFSLICLVVLILLGVMLNLSINYLMEKNLIRHAEEMTAAVVENEVLHELQRNELLAPKLGESYAPFSKKIEHLSLGPNIVRLKIWSRNSVVLWADLPELVGREYSDNHAIEEVIASGEKLVELTWKGHEREESEDELELENKSKRLLELYVPINFPGSNQVDVVFEVYRNLDPLYVEFEHQQQVVWCILFSSFSLLFLALFTLVYRATRKIEKQHQVILSSEAKFRNLIQSAQDGILAVNRSGQIVLSNHSVERIFGYPVEVLVRKELIDLLADENRQPCRKLITQLFQDTNSQREQSYRWQGRRRDGAQFPLELTVAVSGKNGSQLVTAILRDVTELQMMRQKALEAEKQAGVTLIAGSIGHEINNAISGLFGYGQLLKGRSGDSAFVDKCATTMIDQAEQLSQHANNLLTLSKPQKPNIGPLDLNQLIEAVTDLLSTSGLLKHIAIDKQLDSELPLIAGDSHQLEQLVRNLEINAAHAMNGLGSLLLRSGFADDRQVYFEIEDSGPGIPEEQLKQIFEPFFTTKAEGQGTGLGLYIARQVVEVHGGEMSVVSTVGTGTRFRICFPVPFNKSVSVSSC
jgi:two-component system, NtrC family, sensor kinase